MHKKNNNKKKNTNFVSLFGMITIFAIRGWKKKKTNPRHQQLRQLRQRQQQQNQQQLQYTHTAVQT